MTIKMLNDADYEKIVQLITDGKLTLNDFAVDLQRCINSYIERTKKEELKTMFNVSNDDAILEIIKENVETGFAHQMRDLYKIDNTQKWLKEHGLDLKITVKSVF